MKFLFDFLPVVLFFIAFKFGNIYIATFVAMGASGIQVLLTWYLNRHVETMHLITLGSIVILGGATLFFQDEMFIKWKPTVINWLMATAFLGSQLIGKSTLVEKMMGQHISLAQDIWTKLNISWSGFFFLMGAINLYVVYNFDTETWVNFKLFGLLGLTVLFVVLQAAYLTQHISNAQQS